jgi:hypothetical protein
LISVLVLCHSCMVSHGVTRCASSHMGWFVVMGPPPSCHLLGDSQVFSVAKNNAIFVHLVVITIHIFQI